MVLDDQKAKNGLIRPSFCSFHQQIDYTAHHRPPFPSLFPSSHHHKVPKVSPPPLPSLSAFRKGPAVPVRPADAVIISLCWPIPNSLGSVLCCCPSSISPKTQKKKSCLCLGIDVRPLLGSFDEEFHCIAFSFPKTDTWRLRGRVKMGKRKGKGREGGEMRGGRAVAHPPFPPPPPSLSFSSIHWAQ